MSRRNSSNSASGFRPPTDLSGNLILQAKKYLNGWTPEQERLMAKWADIAGCYRWLHDRAEKGFSRGNALITIPVIILSTLTGTASFALSSFIPPENVAMKNYAQAGIGTFSILAGIMSTLGNFLRYAQGSEAHRVAGVAWGKLHRQITVEVAIHPDDREDSMTFLQVCRQDLDRLVEQSPPIPDKVIAEFEKEFSDISGLQRPDICHGLEHTTIYNSTKPRLMRMVTDATIYLKQRKKLLHDDILPDMKERIKKTVSTELESKMRQQWAEFEERTAMAKAAVKPVVPFPNASFVANWRRFLKMKPAAVGKDAQRESINNDYDEMVSIQSESPNSRTNSLTHQQITDNISSRSSSSDIVVAIQVETEPTPNTGALAPIFIPNTTPTADLSGAVTFVDLSGSEAPQEPIVDVSGVYADV